MPEDTKPSASGPQPSAALTHAAAKPLDVPTKGAQLLIAERERVRSALSDGQFVSVRADVLCALLDRGDAGKRQTAKTTQPAPRTPNRLSEDDVRNLRAPGLYGDSGGLYLDIRDGGQRYWLLRYQLRGRRRDMSLGAVSDANGLAAARQAAKEARALIAKGKDPLDERRRLRDRRERAMPAPSFADASRELIETLAPSWRGRTTQSRWERCLLTYAARLGKKPVDNITTADVLAVLKPIWSTKSESAAKARECIERVLDAQRAAGAIRGLWENPARWKGHLAHLLPPRRKLARGHHPAMPYEEVPAFMTAVRSEAGMGARALEFTILTAAREGTVIKARWEEIAGDVWTIPATRMKAAAAFRVPLSISAQALLGRLRADRDGWIFPGQAQARHRRSGPPHISDATMDAVLKRMGLPYTPHGFRSTFRDWAGDCTEHPRDVAEMCLAHTVGDAVERAYRRSDGLERRRRLMEDWAAYLGGAS